MDDVTVTEARFVTAPVDPTGALVSAVGYETVGAGPRDHRGLPSPFLTFIVTLDTPVVIRRKVERGLDVVVAELAERVYLSRRRISTLFAAEFGLTPKEAARTMRFTHAVARIVEGVRGGVLDLASVAAECGFADQPHLDREFRDFAGRPRADRLPGRGVRLRRDRRLRGGRAHPPCPARLARGRRRDARPGPAGDLVDAQTGDQRRLRRHHRYRRAARSRVAAGAEIVEGPVDREYGSRDFIARDPEGNLWSFGTYAGAPRTS
jgi:AraC-like DNA-binding protein